LDALPEQVSSQHVAVLGEPKMLTHAVERGLRFGGRAITRATHVIQRRTLSRFDLPDVEPKTALKDAAVEAKIVQLCAHSTAGASWRHDSKLTPSGTLSWPMKRQRLH